MEPQQQQQQNPPANEENGKGGGYLCRQTSTRWTPTTEQIRILKDLYYNNGVRSPSADQIQKISARLRQYGKIEGKNVFYWFQNHKARERQKKRFTTTSTSITNTTNTTIATIATELPMQRPPPNITHAPWKPYEDPVHAKYHNVNSAGVSTGPSHSSAGVFTIGQVRNYGYGSKTMEKSFRDCSISSSGGNGVSESVGHNFGWIGFDPYASSYPFFDKNKSVLDDHNQEEEENEKEDIETLPLFPMHGEDSSNIFCNVKHSSDTQNYTSSWYFSDDGNAAARTSLELSLNSYGTGRSTD